MQHQPIEEYYEDEYQTDFHLKNLNHIEKLKDKKRIQQEEQFLKEQKQTKLKEHLKQKVLNEAVQRREVKQQLLEKVYLEDKAMIQTQPIPKSLSVNRKMAQPSEKGGFKPKLNSTNHIPKVVTKQVMEHSPTLLPTQTINEEKVVQKNQINNFFRSRYASFLNTLTENKKEKLRQEEFEKEKKDRQVSKIRSEMGLEKVQSKILEPTKATVLRNQEIIKKKEELQAHLSEEEEEKSNSALREASKKLVEKQKLYLQQLIAKKQVEKELKEKEKQKKEKINSDLKQQVLASLSESVQLKKPGDIIESYKKEKVISENLQALDLQTSTQKKPQKLKSVKENLKEEQDNEDDDEAQEDTPSRPKKLRSYPFITDLKIWKKKQRLDDSVRVFIIMGGYPDLKKALLKRGWVENPDHRSPCYDLKFTLMSKDIDYQALNETQIVNHYEKNTAITTKIGICKNLRNLIWFNNVDIDSFYPRCFDCNDENDFEDFLEDFKTTKAESVLKLYMHYYKQNDQSSIDSLMQRAIVALRVCKRKVKDINIIIDENQKSNLKLVSDKEWEILSQDDLSADTLAKNKHEKWLRKIEKSDPALKKKKLKKKQSINQSDQVDQTQQDQEEDEQMNELTKQIKEVLSQFKLKYPQYHLNGWENIWIIKPASLSRGRGIKCYQNLVEILDHMGSKESQWVIQKYIERPIIVMKRKMDIRQWVVVCDWNPLTIWLYDECYLRFTAEDYDTSDISNQLMHLTNNSVTKKSKKDQEIVGNMWFEHQFAQFMRDNNEGKDVFYDSIKPQIKQAVLWSLESVQDQVENRKNSFEMFGYDFMVDEKNKVWLIEVNSSPAMDYSTHITEKLVKEGLSELAKVIVDYNLAPKAQRSSIDTGKFSCLHRGKSIVEKPSSLGVNLCVEGKAMKK